MYYLFPFGKVKQGAKIIIYGAGTVGQWFLTQLKDTGFAEVVAVVDKAYRQYQDLGAELIAPETIMEIEFDVVVIAVEKIELADEIRKYLIEQCQVVQERIIWGGEVKYTEPAIVHMITRDSDNLPPFAFQRQEVSLAALMRGGLGDDIISKYFLEAVIDLAEGKLSIDLYCNKYNRKYVEAIFQEPCYRIYDEPGLFERKRTCYDIVVNAEYILQLDYVDEVHLNSRVPKLATMIAKMRNSVDDYGLNPNHPCESYIHFARSRYLGWNAYAATSHGLLNFKNNKVHIPLQAAGKICFRELGVYYPFVTINYGWGTREWRKGLPAKVWPFSYYEELVKLLHDEFPKLFILQLGVPGSEPIKGTDLFLNKESIETVKYILQESSLHIDCEGGLVHLATQLGTKCAVMFGPTPQSYFGYEDNINICAGVCEPCYYCYDDFTVCARKLEEPECMQALKPQIVMDSIRPFLQTYCQIGK